MSGKEMANDINRAINSGGYVIVPEKAVDGTGRNAIYVYMTYDGQTGAQGWKISGGVLSALRTVVFSVSFCWFFAILLAGFLPISKQKLNWR